MTARQPPPLVKTWMGRNIDDMPREDLVRSLKLAGRLLHDATSRVMVPLDVHVSGPPLETVLGRVLNWAYLTGDRKWTVGDCNVLADSLEVFTKAHGLPTGNVLISGNRIDIEIPGVLSAEQRVAFQRWLDEETERFTAAGEARK